MSSRLLSIVYFLACIATQPLRNLPGRMTFKDDHFSADVLTRFPLISFLKS